MTEKIFKSIHLHFNIDQEPFKSIVMPKNMPIPLRGDVIGMYHRRYDNKYERYKVFQVQYFLDTEDNLMEIIVKAVYE